MNEKLSSDELVRRLLNRIEAIFKMHQEGMINSLASQMNESYGFVNEPMTEEQWVDLISTLDSDDGCFEGFQHTIDTDEEFEKLSEQWDEFEWKTSTEESIHHSSLGEKVDQLFREMIQKSWAQWKAANQPA